MLNEVFAILIPFFNEKIAEFKLQMPKRILGLFDLSDLHFVHKDHYIQFGVTPKFVAPGAQLSKPVEFETHEVEQVLFLQ